MKNNYTLRNVSRGHCSSGLIDPPCQLKILQFTERSIPTELRKISLKSKGQNKVLLLPCSHITPPFSFQKFRQSWDSHNLTQDQETISRSISCPNTYMCNGHQSKFWWNMEFSKYFKSNSNFQTLTAGYEKQKDWGKK